MNITIKVTYILLICVVIIACGQGGDRFLWKYDKAEDVYRINLKSFGIVSTDIELPDGTIVNENKPITAVVKETLTDINGNEPTPEEVVSVTKQVVEELVEQAITETPEPVEDESGTAESETTDTSRDTNQELFSESPTEEEVNTLVEEIVETETETETETEIVSETDSTDTAPEDGIPLSPVDTEEITQQAQDGTSNIAFLTPFGYTHDGITAVGNYDVQVYCSSVLETPVQQPDGRYAITTKFRVGASTKTFRTYQYRRVSESTLNNYNSFVNVILQMKRADWTRLGISEHEEQEHRHAGGVVNNSVYIPDGDLWHNHANYATKHRHGHMHDLTGAN
ncbi:hypothetical protein JT359_09315 [Candidatus Poribacteria bacterium]|nr:hypothetical protein [Candidatus Poribacteria bacterium]